MSLMPVRQRGVRRIDASEILFLSGNGGTVGILKSVKPRMVFIGTPDEDEIVMFLEKEDLIVISAFDEGPNIEKGIKCMGYLLREMESPIVVLPDNHPTSQRLKMVVAVGDSVRLDCNITPGTHPEQDILCTCNELSGVKLSSTENGVLIEGDIANLKLDKL